MREEYGVELKDFQKDYLNEMVEKYDLPDVGKAVRILIDFSFERSDLEEEIFGESRCHSCS